MQFSSILGQEDLKNRLVNGLVNGRVSHAQMWLGNAGYGVLPLALAYCQYLFCENPGPKDSCGVCSSCQKVEKLQHPDLHFAFPVILSEGDHADIFYKDWRRKIFENPYFDLNQWTLTIDDKGRKPVIGNQESQNILKKLRLKSFEGGFKIMLIWMAEEMNETASNKLLKILEEPPEKTLFLLLVENSDKILSTILSRTQLIKIHQIDHTSLSAKLMQDFGMHLTDADSIAYMCEGSWIAAQELASTGSRNIDARDLFIEGFRSAFKKDVIHMMNWANQLAALSREEQKGFLKYGLHLFRQSMLFSYTDEKLIRLSEEELAFVRNFSRFVTGNNFQDLYELFSSSHYYIERNANPKILFTDLIFQVMKLIHVA
jgi:DNA polymerase III subunit delta'